MVEKGAVKKDRVFSNIQNILAKTNESQKIVEGVLKDYSEDKGGEEGIGKKMWDCLKVADKQQAVNYSNMIILNYRNKMEVVGAKNEVIISNVESLRNHVFDFIDIIKHLKEDIYNLEQELKVANKKRKV